MMLPLPIPHNAQLVQAIPHNENHGCFLIRLDRIDPIISGNKWFKLQPFLEQAQANGFRRIVTFGGPYSNHLVATASACQRLGWGCTGIVRGADPSHQTPTLQRCVDLGMELTRVDATRYRLWQTTLPESFQDALMIPEGGYHPLGASGAAAIAASIPPNITHILVAAGTCTTLAGIWQGSLSHQTVVGIPVLKGMTDQHERLQYLVADKTPKAKLVWLDGFHHGGYAKHTRPLLDCMNQLFENHQVPTDFVYTGKLWYAYQQLVQKNYFPTGSQVALIHSGGLQGNAGLSPGSLIF